MKYIFHKFASHQPSFCKHLYLPLVMTSLSLYLMRTSCQMPMRTSLLKRCLPNSMPSENTLPTSSTPATERSQTPRF